MKNKAKQKEDLSNFGDLGGDSVTGMELGVGVAASCAAGVSVAGALRLTGLSWSVAFAGVPVAPLVGKVDTLSGIWVGLATAVALVVGFASSYYEKQKGGEAKRREEDRVGLARLARRSIDMHRARGSRLRDGRLALGLGQGDVVKVSLGSASNGVHTFIPGKTGSGKTVTAATLLAGQIRSGASVIAIDPKDDGDLTSALREEAAGAGVPFLEVQPGSSQYGYNVAQCGGDSEVAEKILSAHEWSEPHYKSIAQRFAQATVGVLRACEQQVSLKTVGYYMHPDRLEALAAKHQVGTKQVERLVTDLPRRMLDDLAGARSRIAVLADSDHGKWLDPAQVRPIDLDAVLKQHAVVVFRLDSAGHPDLTKLLAASLVLDLTALSGRMRSTPQRAGVFLDEFAELAADQISRLLATGRSAGMSVILAAQSFADLDAARGDGTLTKQVVGNCEYCIAHQTPDPESAELLAGLTGTYATWTQTEAYSASFLAGPDARSKIPTREYQVHPDVFKALPTGEAVIIPRDGSHVAERIRIWSSRLFPIIRGDRGRGGSDE